MTSQICSLERSLCLSTVRRTGNREGKNRRTWQSSWAVARSRCEMVGLGTDSRHYFTDMLNTMWGQCHLRPGPLGLLPAAQSFKGPHIPHTHGHTHTRTHTCKVHSATHKHLCHLGSGTWYWHRVTHSPKHPSSQPTVFRPQGNNSSHLVLYP